MSQSQWLCGVCKTANTSVLVCSKCFAVKPSVPNSGPNFVKKGVQNAVNEVRGLYRYWQVDLPLQRIDEVAQGAYQGKKFDPKSEKKPRKQHVVVNNQLRNELIKAGLIKNGKPTIA